MRVATGRVGHAYLMEGRTGLLEAANAFAKALNCLNGGEVACDTCISCRVLDSGNHPDTFYVTATKTIAIGVEDVRHQVVAEMATRPFRYKYKVFIIDKAETMTPAAQNALLKTIEEPAPYGVFLLLTKELELMLETVLSRCVIIKVNENGQPGALQRETDEAHMALAQEVIENAHKLDILGALMLYKKFEPLKESKESAVALLDMLYERYGTLVRQTQAEYAFRATRAITQTKDLLSQNGNYQLAIEIMLLKIGAHIQ
ncbi:MAG: hypothetical protein FWC71_02455 [Defluviitaleaceae bacterium]|nr:hypothetical protein [Defluviitaleaceae bacterium]